MFEFVVSAAFIVALVIVACWLRSRTRRKVAAKNAATVLQEEREAFADLLIRAAAGEEEAYEELSELTTWGHFELTERLGNGLALRVMVDQVLRQQANERLFAATIGPMTKLFAACRVPGASREDTITAVLAYLDEFDRECHDGIWRRISEHVGMTSEEMRGFLSGLIAAEFHALLEQAEQGDAEALHRAYQLYDEVNGNRYASRFYRKGVANLSRPQQWNDLVGRHVESPGLAAFDLDAFTRRHNIVPTPRELALLAAKTVEGQDITDAKIILAYGTESTKCAEVRRAIGEILWADLVRIAARVRQIR